MSNPNITEYPIKVVPKAVPVKIVQCRNTYESVFETLITNFINPRVRIFDKLDKSNKPELVFVEKTKPDTTIEHVVDYYMQNIMHLDAECMTRAFIASVHFAVDDRSSKLSKWFATVRPDIMKNISIAIMLTVLSGLISANDAQISSKFFVEYVFWLVESYVTQLAQEQEADRRIFICSLLTYINEELESHDSKINKQLLSSFVKQFYPKVEELCQKIGLG